MMTDKKPQNSIIREFTLSTASVDNKTSVFVLVFLITLIGLTAYITMPKESFPEIKMPTIYIGTAHPGNSPLDMENLIARPIEKEVNSITGVKNIKSTNIQDYSTIIVEFDLDVPADEALLDVKDAVDRAKADLPKDLPADPNVFELNMSEMPILNINMFGVNDIEKLNDYAEYLQEEIEKLGEISGVDIKGVPEKEVSINVDIHKLDARNLGFGDIEGAIGAENITLSGGDILSDGIRRNVRIVGEFDSMDEIANIIISNQNNSIVYLRDVATVEFDYADRTSYARTNQLPVVTLDVKKRSGENLINAVQSIRNIVAEAKESRFPKALEIKLLNDQSKFTKSMLDNLENSIISGVILVVLVLQFFLGIRNALFVGVAIPLSMLTGFMILGFAGVTLNMMVLFSLILALGMLVDNGIVVVENIYRYMDEGYDAITSAKQGVGEVAWPIITSTATTLAAFLPLLFWQDMMGEFMKFLPITLIIVLASSLFVGLVVNPVLTAVLMKIDDPNVVANRKGIVKWSVIALAIAAILYAVGYSTDASGTRMLGGLFLWSALLVLLNAFILTPGANYFQLHFLPRLENGYKSFITKALVGRRPIFFVLGTFALLVLSIGIMGASGLTVNLFPINQPNNIHIYVEEAVGADIDKTNGLTKKIEQIVLDKLKPYDYMVEAVLGQVGEGTSDPSAGPQQGSSPNKSRITIAFLEYEYRRGVSTLDIMKEIREAVGAYPDVQITVDKDAMGPPTGPPINIEVAGDDFTQLLLLTNNIRSYLNDAGVQGVEELKIDLETGKPELLIDINRENARRFGLSTGQIASTIRTSIFGKEISKYKSGEDDYPIQLRFNEESRYDIPSILNQKITFRNNQGQLLQIPIASVATVEPTSTYGSVKRKNLDRVITIYSNVTEGYNGNSIVQQYKKLLANYDLPEAYTVKFTGEQEDQQESAAFLMNAMIIAVFLIFLILVTQFNSVTKPFIILVSVLLSTIGVFLGYTIFRMDFIIIMTGIGIISLAGVVVNNAIVLIDYANLVGNRRRKELGLAPDARLPKKIFVETIIEAGTKRLRPVLLTAITTVLGLIPLATGMNINFFSLLSDFNAQIYFGGDNAIFWGPMAWTVIFGLVFATAVTLIIVPVMYLLEDRIAAYFSKESEKTVTYNPEAKGGLATALRRDKSDQ